MGKSICTVKSGRFLGLLPMEAVGRGKHQSEGHVEAHGLSFSVLMLLDTYPGTPAIAMISAIA